MLCGPPCVARMALNPCANFLILASGNLVAVADAILIFEVCPDLLILPPRLARNGEEALSLRLGNERDFLRR